MLPPTCETSRSRASAPVLLLQLPKPKWVDRGLKAKTLFLTSPPGLWVRRCYLAAHGALFLRCVGASAGSLSTCSTLSLTIYCAPSMLLWHSPVWCGGSTAACSAGAPAADRLLSYSAGCPSRLFLPCREVWRNLFAPGTFRGALRAAWRTLTTGERFQWPQPCAGTDGEAAAAAQLGLVAAAAAAAAADSDSWYITHRDLAHFKATLEEGAAPRGTSAWEPMMQKQWPGCTYTAWRRTLPSGKAEYKSITISGEWMP